MSEEVVVAVFAAERRREVSGTLAGERSELRISNLTRILTTL